MNKGFRDLRVWQKAVDLSINIYRLTDKGKLKNDYGLKDQLRRSSVSIASNIAEGDERETDKESVRFFYVAKGSCAELLTQVEIALKIEAISREEFKEIENLCNEISGMLTKLISARSQTFSKHRPSPKPYALSLKPVGGEVADG